MKQQPIPEAAIEDEQAVEMLRVWIAKRRLHASIKIGMYRENKAVSIDEERAWGIILADTARHVSVALRDGYGLDAQDCLVAIRESFLKELDAPTSETDGTFVKKH